MSARFRPGDVVRWDNGDVSRIEVPPGDTSSPWGAGISAYWVRDVDNPKRSGWALADSLTLLRRPVRVGDVLRLDPDYEVRVTRLDPQAGPVGVRVGASYLVGEASCSGSWALVARNWTHADGTPIDPPAAEPAKASAPRVDSMLRAVKSVWSAPCLIEADPSVPPSVILPKTTGPSWSSVAASRQRLLDAERQRNSQLADEAGALRSERDELLRENATLRRTIERLERKGGRR